jgi:HSP20 family protein
LVHSMIIYMVVYRKNGIGVIEMDMDKLKQWMQLAQNMQGGDFWKNIFDQEFAKQFINEQPFKTPFASGENQAREEVKTAKSFPLIDILEGEQEVLVVIELPGVAKENIELALSGNVLTIKGNAMPLHPHLKHTYSERFYGEFQRQITLPDTVNPGDLKAKFWNGILFVNYHRIIEPRETIPIE